MKTRLTDVDEKIGADELPLGVAETGENLIKRIVPWDKWTLQDSQNLPKDVKLRILCCKVADLQQEAVDAFVAAHLTPGSRG